MIELVFVIVVIAILATIAIPKFAATRDDANIAKARSTIAAVRSGIVNERQKRLFKGDNSYINRLDAGVTSNTAGVTIFDNNGTAANEILMYGITTKAGSGYWMKSGNNQYDFTIGSDVARYTYNPANGRITCADQAGSLCGSLE